MAVGALTGLVIMRRRGDLRREKLIARSAKADGLGPVGWLAGGMVLWLAWQLAGAAAHGALGAPPPGEADDSLERNARALWPAYCVAFGGAGIIFAALRTRLVRAGFTARLVDPLLGAGLLLLVYPWVYIAGDLSLRIADLLAARGVIDAPDGPAHDTLRQLVDAPQHDLWWWIVTLLVTVAAPTLEEIIHRGFFQTALIRATGKPWLGIALASALFTLVHAAAVPFYAMPALFVFSLALGWAFERTGRLAVPIVMHAAFNALNIAAATAAG